MPRKKLSRNALCPCGSGKKYKHCCYGKGFEWVQDDDGTIKRSVPMSDEMVEVLQRSRQDFIDKHGREPGPDDLVFPDVPHPEHLEHIMVEGMKEADVDPAIIYAFEKTGLLVTEQNQRLLPEKDITDWNDAIEEYHSQQFDEDETPRYPIGTVALYGPDDTTTTKIAAGVIVHDGADVIVRRWVGTDVQEDPRVQEELRAFFEEHEVQSVIASDGNMGCPHEEGEDFPVGEDCPFCPYWKGKQGSGAEIDDDPWF